MAPPGRRTSPGVRLQSLIEPRASLRGTTNSNPDPASIADAFAASPQRSLVAVLDTTGPFELLTVPPGGSPTRTSIFDTGFGTNATRSAAFLGSGTLLALENEQGRVAIWDVGDASSPQLLDQSQVLGAGTMAGSPDERSYALAVDGTFQSWDADAAVRFVPTRSARPVRSSAKVHRNRIGER